MKTIQFASYELNKYLATMGVSAEISLSVDASAFDSGRFEHYDPLLDDAFSVSVKNAYGSIVGTNSRAVLMGVYHYLKRQGCRFMMPGKDGEWIPQIDRLCDVTETWYAYTRHRGTTDSMADSGGIEGILSFIDWLPKMMMNTYFIELTDSYYDMWECYLHVNNPYKAPDSLAREQFEKWHDWTVREIKKRGILYHTAGHGWTNMLMEGITETRRKAVIDRLQDKTPCLNPEILPEINGKRGLSGDTPLNTNLCFSQDKVRSDYAKKVYEYSVKHPEVDYLHVWLGDAYANFCECENCRKKTPTDWYIKMLNEIDEEFETHGSAQKIVFLGYFELMDIPVTEKIHNEKRFTFLFCPFGRDFTKRYRDWKVLEVAPHPLNSFKESDMHMGRYLGQLKKWKKWFNGDCAVFDYNLYDSTAHADISHMMPAPIMSDDCLYMKNIGLNGRIECGNNLYMLPTPIAWHAMSEALFYGETYSEEAFFADFYGPGEPVSKLLYMIKDAVPLDYILCKKTSLTENEKRKLEAVVEKIRSFHEAFFKYSPDSAFHRKNCSLFAEYLDLAEFVFDAVIQLSNHASCEKASALLEDSRRLVFRKESAMPYYMSGRTWFGLFEALIQNYIYRITHEGKS